jgi:hypothetical protein
MPGTGSVTYVLGPIAIAIVFGALVLVLRWAFNRGPVVIERSVPDHGLLQPVADASNPDDLEPIRQALSQAGIRSTLTRAVDGQRLLVWPADLATARTLTKRVLGSR